MHIPALLREHFGVSARRGAAPDLQSGGVRVNGEQVQELDVPASALDGAVVQVGKRRFKRFRTP